MAGHSKWKNIRIRKGKQDALRAKLFTKLSREIILAVKNGGSDPAHNARLRVVLEKAKESSLPAENIKRSIQRGTGEIEGVNYEELTYEGYGPSGSAIIVECYTENKNRTVADLRHIFSKNGGNLSENGSVSWQFKYLGHIQIEKKHTSEDHIMLDAIDSGAEDVAFSDDIADIYTSPDELHKVHANLSEKNYKSTIVELTYVPTNYAEIPSEDIEKLIKLIDTLEEHDDVKDIYINIDLSSVVEA